MNNEEKILQAITDLESRINNRLDKMDGRLDRLEEDVSIIRDAGVRMEIEFGNELKATAEAYGAVKAKLDEHTQTLARMERKIDDLDTYVTVHDVKLKAMSK